MAKATITLTDNEEEGGGVTINLTFDPALPNEDSQEPDTPAQWAACKALKYLTELAEEE